MNKKANLIKVDYGSATKIARAFGCTKAKVSQALSGRRSVDSELTKKIRHVALTQYNGTELEPVKRIIRNKQKDL